MKKKKIIFIRRNNFDTMLDKATWVKTVENLNNIENCSAEAIFFTKKGDYKAPIGVRLIKTSTLRGVWYFEFLIKLFRLLINIIKSNEDTVLFFDVFTFPLLPFVRFIRIRNRRTLYYIDYRTFYFNFNDNQKDSLRDKFYRLITILSFKYAKRNNISISIIVDEMKSFIAKYISIDKINFLVWSSGVEPNDFSFSKSELDVFKKKYKWLKNNPVFLYHGHLTDNRGIDKVIDAFGAMNNNIKYYFLIVGDGPSKKKLLDKIREHNLFEKCIFIGKVPYNQIKFFIEISDVAVVTYPIINYWKYNNPIKFSEYMLLNKYILTSKIDSFEKMVKHGNGFVLDSVDTENLKNTLTYCCTHIDQIRKKNKTNNSRQFILKNYTWEHQANKIINHILSNL